MERTQVDLAQIRTDLDFYEARQQEDRDVAIIEMRVNLGFEPLKEQSVKPTSDLIYSSRYSIEDAIELKRRKLGLSLKY